MNSLYLSLIGGLLMGVSWLWPLDQVASILSFTGLCFLSACLSRSTRIARDWFLAGLVIHLIGFYWLIGTIRDFGGFPVTLAIGIYLFFATASSIQYLIAAFLFKRLPSWARDLHLAFALAWVSSNFLWIRIFPWEPGHLPLMEWISQLAAIGGETAVTFVHLWAAGIVAGFFCQVLSRGQPTPGIRLSALGLSCLLILGLYWSSLRAAYFAEPPERSAKVPVTLVQANVSVEEKHNVRFFGDNIERYKRLSDPFVGKGRLIVWPESVNQEWVHTSFRWANQSPALIPLAKYAPLHLGTLSFETPTKIHNSAITLSTSTISHAKYSEPASELLHTEISAPYHKRVLMPFGEYVPLSGLFPFLRNLVPMAAEFSPGDGPVIQTAQVGENSIKLAPLICYEDIVPSMAAEAVKAGGTVLVSISNDGWFGKTPAPLQHHRLATFRAIETGRYFLRSTNTGLTAIVNPLGQTVGSLPGFADGVLSQDIFPLTEATPFVKYDGGKMWWIVAALTIGYVLLRSLGRSTVRKKAS